MKNGAGQPPAADGPTRRTARTPVRERGLLRQAALLDATEALLLKQSAESIGIYQIAERAAVPPASVYHFFPTRDAAFAALAARFMKGIRRVILDPAPATEMGSWQDLFRLEQKRVQLGFNAHPAALKLFYAYSSDALRLADIRLADEMFERIYPTLDLLFHMPPIDRASHRFRVALVAADAVWALSCARHGKITDEYFEEALAVHNAYCGLFLPEIVEPRKTLLSAAAQGGTISLTPEEQPSAVDPDGSDT